MNNKKEMLGPVFIVRSEGNNYLNSIYLYYDQIKEADIGTKWINHDLYNVTYEEILKIYQDSESIAVVYRFHKVDGNKDTVVKTRVIMISESEVP